MYVCVYVYVSAGALRGNEGVGLLKLEVGDILHACCGTSLCLLQE